MNRQQRRAIERANAKHPPKIMSPSAMQLCVAAALPFLVRPALNSKFHNIDETQADASSNEAGGAGVVTAETKACHTCKETKPITEFHLSSARGKRWRNRDCNVCRNDRTRAKREAIAKEIREAKALRAANDLPPKSKELDKPVR